MHAQFHSTRQVWADLTAHPSASIREICARTGLSHEAVQLAIHVLDTVGYIERDPREARARRVIVPFITEFVIHERQPV